MSSDDVPIGAQSRYRPQLAVWLVLSLFIAVIWLHSLDLIKQDRVQAISSAETELANLTRLTQEHAQQTIGNIDQAMHRIVVQYRKHGLSADLKMMTEQSLLDNNSLQQIDILDAHGKLQLRSASSSDHVDISQQDYFEKHQATRSDGLLISRPVLNPSSGKWSIYLSRRMTHENGAFAGVVVTRIDPGYFTRFYGELDLGKQPVASLFGTDGWIRARRVAGRDEFTGNVSTNPILHRLINGENNLVATYHAITDGIERTYFFRKLSSYPLVVTVGMETQDILARHAITRASYLRQTAFASLLVFALALFLSWYLLTRQRLAAAQQQREQYLRALLDNFPFMVWLKDEKSRFLSVNQTFASQFGWKNAESMIGMSDDDIASPAFAQAYRADDLEVLRSGISKQVDELIYTEGQAKWFETYKSPVKVNGQSIGTVGFARNITERKRIEAELMAAKADAEQANRAKSRFLAAASHDLRQPLTGLSLLVGLLKKKIPPDCAGVMSNIQICIDSLSELLNDLLDISKLEAGVVIPKVSDIAVNDIFAKLASIHTAEAELKGLRLRFRRSNNFGCTDPQLLQRIVGNLVANAIRYTNKGGVLVACRRHMGKQWIEVWDTGIGIDADKTGIIFEEFRQLGDASRNRGSGLGLAIVAKAASLLGLEIRVRSRPGHGSLFAIEVPQGDLIQTHEVALTEAVSQVLRVGLVDDNALVLEALTLSLESEGHEVVAAACGKLLIEKLGQRMPDIVISDYRLSDGLTGFDVISSVRDIFGEALPGILITGDTDPSLVSTMAKRGISVHYKPLQMDAFYMVIKQVIEVGKG